MTNESEQEMYGEDQVTRYNYDEFVLDTPNFGLDWKSSPPLYSPSPDFPLWTLDGGKTWLSKIWSRWSYTIVEFGSISCPTCHIHAAALDEVAQRYSGQGIGSIFLYTHEVHPGENVRPVISLAQKLDHARRLRVLTCLRRPILVDGLDGACHRAYGSMPNMAWIFNQAGLPVYKANWTDSESIDVAVDHFLHVRKRHCAGETLRPVLVESLTFQTEDRMAFYQVLAENGRKAVHEYHAAVCNFLARVS